MPYLYGQREVYLEGENRGNFFPTTLPQGQIQDFRKLRAECKAKGQLFEDPAFIAGPGALGEVKIVTKHNVPIVWKRPREINPDSVFSSIDHTDGSGKEIYRADIEQGSLGDCYYIAAVGILLGSKKLTEFVIPTDNGEDESAGIYHFRFWMQGVYFDFVVDDRLPYRDNGDGTYDLVFAKNNGNDIWPMLLEKAYSKMHGSYAVVGKGGNVGVAVQEMSGGITQSIRLTGKEGEVKWLDFFAKMQFGVLTGLSTPTGTDKGIIGHHCYSVVDKEKVTNNQGNEFRLLHIRNPWGGRGGAEWTGGWSDKSPLWDTIPAEDKARMNKDLTDGEFWMTFREVTSGNTFGSVHFCHWRYDLDKVPDTTRHHWQWEDVHGGWSGEGTGDIQHAVGLAKKPQYLVTIKQDDTSKEHPNGILIISLVCKGYLKKIWKRPTKLNFKVYKVKDQTLINRKPPYGPKPFDDPQRMQEIDFNEMKRLDHEHTAQKVVSAGSYLIVPFTTPGVVHNFVLRIGSAHKFTVHPDPPTPGEKQNLKYYDEG